LSTLAFVFGFGFYGFTTYVSIVNSYAPFSSPVSRLLARGPEILETWRLAITRNARRITSAIISVYNRPPPPLQEQQPDADSSHQSVQSLPLNSDMAEPPEPHPANGAEKSNTLPHSRSDIDSQMHIHVLERLVTTTAEAAENIPIFLELLDQPVKDRTLRPLNVEKWRKLLHITLGLLKDQSTFPVSAAWTLARTMMICYNRKTADQQLCVTLRHHIGSRETDRTRSRMPLDLLFSFYWRFWLDDPNWFGDEWRSIALIEPSDAADAELLWMVNTFHRNRLSDKYFLEFFVAVLTYVSSTEQSRRSQVPLTAAVIYALHTLRLAHDHGGINSIDRLYILPGTVSNSESVPMTFSHVEGIDALDLWSEECIQFVKDLLQWDWSESWHNDFQLSLIAALYIDSTKQAHARSAFADLVKYTSIKDVRSRFSGVYDQGKLAVYWYMAVSQKSLSQDRYPLAAPYDVIGHTIAEDSTLQLSGLHILDIAVKHVRKAAPTAFNWLSNATSGFAVFAPGDRAAPVVRVDRWVLLHLGTLLAPQRFLLPEEVKGLRWSDTPEKAHIAMVRLDFYDSLAKAEHEGAKEREPDPGLLKVFLWSKDRGVCTRTFKWCLDLVLISQPDSLADTEGARVFIPEPMGFEWVEHFISVLCQGNDWQRDWSRGFLISHLVPKWTMLPSSWCCDFASAFLFSIVHPEGMHGLPAYQFLAGPIVFTEPRGFLPFIATMLELVHSSLTWARLTSLENWLAQLPGELENEDAHTQIGDILATRKQQIMPQIIEETLRFFAELPMAGLLMDE